MQHAIGMVGRAPVAARPPQQRPAPQAVAVPVVPARVCVKEMQQDRASVIVEMGRRASKIAERKGKSDAKKAKVYGRIGKKIVSVVKAGGPDPTANTKLADVLKLAKDANVPKDIVERNIKKASDSKQGDYQEVNYECYGPGGTGFVVECLTDNLNRTASEVKAVITRSWSKVAEPGSVMFNFNRCGQIYVEGCGEDEAFEAAVDAEADDVVPVPADEDGTPSTSYRFFTSVENWGRAKARLAELGLRINEEESGLVFRASAPVEVDDDAFTKCETLTERLLELDDVDAVYSNCEGLII